MKQLKQRSQTGIVKRGVSQSGGHAGKKKETLPISQGSMLSTVIARANIYLRGGRLNNYGATHLHNNFASGAPQIADYVRQRCTPKSSYALFCFGKACKQKACAVSFVFVASVVGTFVLFVCSPIFLFVLASPLSLCVSVPFYVDPAARGSLRNTWAVTGSHIKIRETTSTCVSIG